MTLFVTNATNLGDMTIIFGYIALVSGDLTSGEMTYGRLVEQERMDVLIKEHVFNPLVINAAVNGRAWTCSCS